MSPLCQLQMTLPRGFAGGVWGDGSADERSGAAATRGPAGFGSAATDARGSRATARVGEASSVSAVEGLSDRRFILELSEEAKAAIGKRLTVVDYPDGRLTIRYRGVELAYRTFDKIQQVDQGAIVENKRLGAALAFIREEQLRRGPERRSGPRRRD